LVTHTGSSFQILIADSRGLTVPYSVQEHTTSHLRQPRQFSG